MVERRLLPIGKASFRELVRIRDACCSLTGTMFFSCEAAHIVPESRPDVSRQRPDLGVRSVVLFQYDSSWSNLILQVYRAILGLRDEEPIGEMFQASAGLLLRPDLHKAFDNLDISFYYKVGGIFLPSSHMTC
jgi:hypothetical protein